MTNKEYKISIIIPVYNVEKYVEKSIESVISQNIDKEIIIVNDGSTDGSAEIISKYANLENCIIINKENAGLGAARNTGLRVAQGDYILFLDSDDYLVPNSLEKMYEEMHSENLDVIQCAYCHINEQGEAIGGEDIIESTDIMSGREWIRKGHISYGACFCMYNYEFLKTHNLEFMEGVLHEDMDFTLHATYLARRIKSLNFVFYNYLIRPSSITTNKSVKRCTDYYKIAKNVEKWVSSEVDEETYLAFFENYIVFLFSHIINLAIIQNIKIEEIVKDERLRIDVLSHLKNSKAKKYKLEYLLLKCKLYKLYASLYKLFRKEEG